MDLSIPPAQNMQVISKQIWPAGKIRSSFFFFAAIKICFCVHSPHQQTLVLSSVTCLLARLFLKHLSGVREIMKDNEKTKLFVAVKAKN